MHSLVTSFICVRMLIYVMFLPLYIWPIWVIFLQSHTFLSIMGAIWQGVLPAAFRWWPVAQRPWPPEELL